MKIIRYIAAAFSMYTKIPMPHFELDGKDCSRAILFLPLPGILIATCVYIADHFMYDHGIPLLVRVCAAVLIPTVITGGFHVDGFCDTVDVLSSYKSRDEKLRIMKDPHIGSFAVTGLGVAALLLMCAFGIILGKASGSVYPANTVAALSSVFVISRALAALTSLYMKKAKDDGMLVSETKIRDSAGFTVISVWLLACAVFTLYTGLKYFFAVWIAFLVFTAYYAYITRKEFGGVTGDTAGYYVTAGEIAAAGAIALVALIFGS